MVKTNEIQKEDIDKLDILLRTTFGSEVHGIDVGSSSDRDEIAIYIPSKEEVFSTASTQDQFIYRSAFERREEDDYFSQPRSRAGDLDLNVYEIRHWARLALAGNPSLMVPLFVENKWVISSSAAGDEVRANRHRFISMQSARRTFGYMEAQHRKMTGAESPSVKRPELVTAHGYDTKFAAHMIRLGIQGLSIISRGEVEMPINDIDSAEIRSIRAGEVEEAEVLEWYRRIHDKFSELIEKNPNGIPERPQYKWVDQWILRSFLDS